MKWTMNVYLECSKIFSPLSLPLIQFISKEQLLEEVGEKSIHCMLAKMKMFMEGALAKQGTKCFHKRMISTHTMQTNIYHFYDNLTCPKFQWLMEVVIVVQDNWLNYKISNIDVDTDKDSDKSHCSNFAD